MRGVGLKLLTDGYCNLGFVLPQAIAPVAILSALVCGVSVWLATLLHCAGAIIDVGVHNYAHAREHGRRTCSWRQGTLPLLCIAVCTGPLNLYKNRKKSKKEKEVFHPLHSGFILN